jgi:polyhydroxyalkanoate synthesis regulator phasin
MNNPLKIGGLVAISLLGATALGAALLLAQDPKLLKRLVKQGTITYHKAVALLAELREELGDVMAEALQQAEDELREADLPAERDLGQGQATENEAV